MVAPEVHVIATSQSFTDYSKRPRIASVKAAVLIPSGSKDRSQAILPTRTDDNVDRYQNLLGAKFEGRSVVAFFPVNAFTEKHDLRIVFDGEVPGDSEVSGCEDCGVPIRLKGIK